MKKNLIRAAVITVIAAIVAAIIAATGGSASADKGDKPQITVGKRDHCINHKEWVNSVRSDKTRFEKSMGVYRDGKTIHVDKYGDSKIVRYPWCGRTVDEGYYEVSYDLNKRGYWMASYFSEWDFTKNAA